MSAIHLPDPGLRPSPDDPRDYISTRLVAGASPPPIQDWIPIYERDNQLRMGSCLAHTITCAIEAYLLRMGVPKSLSRLYVYFWLRALARLHKVDTGGFPRDMCRAVAKFGVCAEALYPYVDENLYRVPTEEAIIEGLQNCDWVYERLPTPGAYDGVDQFAACNAAIKSYIAQGIPVMATLQLNEDFTPRCAGDDWRKHDWMISPRRGAKVTGYHEVLIHAYDDRPDVKRYRVQNWWGDEWGDDCMGDDARPAKGGFGLMYQPRKGQLWQSRVIQELWVVKPK